jgi:hypothetical protein
VKTTKVTSGLQMRFVVLHEALRLSECPNSGQTSKTFREMRVERASEDVVYGLKRMSTGSGVLYVGGGTDRGV